MSAHASERPDVDLWLVRIVVVVAVVIVYYFVAAARAATARVRRELKRLQREK